MRARAARGRATFSPPPGPPRASRADRVGEQLREEISQMMVREMKDPRVRLASVSEVRMAPDLRSARVLVSAVGTEAERHQVVAAMRHAEGFVRAELGHRLENLRSVPRLHFELDESIAYSVRINSMLRDLAPDAAEAAVAGETADAADAGTAPDVARAAPGSTPPSDPQSTPPSKEEDTA